MQVLREVGIVALFVVGIIVLPLLYVDCVNVYPSTQKQTYNCTNVSLSYLFSLTDVAAREYIGKDICVHDAIVTDCWIAYYPYYPWFPKVYCVDLEKDGYHITACTTDENCTTLSKGEHVDVKGVLIHRWSACLCLDLDEAVVIPTNHTS